MTVVTVNGAFPNDVPTAARVYLAKGFAPIPLHYKSKSPLNVDSKNLRVTPETADQHFPANIPLNIGILNGEVSNNLHDVDLDCDEARLVADKLLPHTGCIFGRTTSRRSHWIYRGDRSLSSASEIYTDLDGSVLLELRGTGGHIVSNLLNNSAKYTPNGGQVRVMVNREGEQAVLKVADDGIGIPPAMLGRVFELFVQVDRTLEKTTGGLGIGLSLVKGLVEMHGGTIVARSGGEGKGSEFVVKLPLASNASVASDRVESDKQEVAKSSSRRILVVDDNVDSADSLGQLLEMLGNVVRTVNDGEAGIAEAELFLPDVIIMDIGMPKLNGFEACRRIRQKQWGKDTMLIALTGWGQEDDRKKSSEAGFDYHLVKPVEISVLLQLLAGNSLAHLKR